MSTKINDGDQIYHPKNIKKYIGIPQYAVCRSSWEVIMCRWLDNNPSVIEWGSEVMAIPWFDKIQNKKRRYFPDFFAKIIDKDGNKHQWLIEIKPFKETIPPKPGRTKSQKTKVYESKTWAVNTAKWRAAEEFCRRRGWFFRILTEKQLLQGK